MGQQWSRKNNLYNNGKKGQQQAKVKSSPFISDKTESTNGVQTKNKNKAKQNLVCYVNKITGYEKKRV